jgi:molybdenum-dependent DNA-binding transcriptional regulator ModE
MKKIIIYRMVCKEIKQMNSVAVSKAVATERNGMQGNKADEQRGC